MNTSENRTLTKPSWLNTGLGMGPVPRVVVTGGRVCFSGVPLVARVGR